MPRTETATREIYKFDELSDQAKRKARERLLESGYPDHDWWDSSYEEFVTVALLMGIDIEREKGNARIYFSGFSCQGDGASFIGDYSFEPDAVTAVYERAPQDDTLKEIAQELTSLQVAMRLQHGGTYRCFVGRRGSYYHSNSMVTSDAMVINRGCDHPEGYGDYFDDGAFDDAFQGLLRRFADWMYHYLEDEYNHLTSDESLDEVLAEYEFDESGSMI